MPGRIRATRYGKAINREFEVKGPGQDLQVLDDVMPVAELYDPTDVEHHLPRDEYLWAGSMYLAPAAGNYGRIYVFNGNLRAGGYDENYLTVVEALHVYSSGGGAYYCDIVSTTSGKTVGVVPMRCDARQFPMQAAPAAAWTSDNTSAVAPTSTAKIHIGLMNAWVPVGLVLPPGYGVQIHCATANQWFIVNAVGYDRTWDPAERF